MCEEGCHQCERRGEISPLSIILVSSGHSGDRLLYVYPPPYKNASKDLRSSGIDFDDVSLQAFTDAMLISLLVPKHEQGNVPFEVKVDDVCFLGYPISFDRLDSKSEIKLINCVFALKAPSSHSMERDVIESYQEASKLICLGIRNEESLCAYMSSQLKLMVSILDQLTDHEAHDLLKCFTQEEACKQSSLCEALKEIYTSIATKGYIKTYINKSTFISYSFLSKTVNIHTTSCSPRTTSSPDNSIMPFHTFLLLQSVQSTKSFIHNHPLLVCSRNPLLHILSHYNPCKSFKHIAAETLLPVTYVIQIASHLVSWNKAKLIYPLCENNTYVLVRELSITPELVDAFKRDFCDLSLCHYLQVFSMPIRLKDFFVHSFSEELDVVLWLIKNNVIAQLFTFVYNLYMKPIESISDATYEMVECSSNHLNDDGRAALPSKSILLDQGLSNESDIISSLLPLFDGMHHFEEILFLTNISRSQLTAFLQNNKDKFLTVSRCLSFL